MALLAFEIMQFNIRFELFSCDFGVFGVCLGTQQFDSITNPEVSEFRKKMGDFCEKIASDRDRQVCVRTYNLICAF